MLLAIDTSGATAVALVGDDGAALLDLHTHDRRRHAEDVGPLLRAAFAEAGGAVTAVAAGTGPGPFTGLRVGMAAARAAALGLALPELPVLSHDAVALGALRDGLEPPFVVVADAKRRERFFSVYRGLDAAGVPVADGGPQLGAEADVPVLPRVEGPVVASLLGAVAALRRAAGLPPAPDRARYLRSPDVTPSTGPKPVLR